MASVVELYLYDVALLLLGAFTVALAAMMVALVIDIVDPEADAVRKLFKLEV